MLAPSITSGSKRVKACVERLATEIGSRERLPTSVSDINVLPLSFGMLLCSTMLILALLEAGGLYQKTQQECFVERYK